MAPKHIKCTRPQSGDAAAALLNTLPCTLPLRCTFGKVCLSLPKQLLLLRSGLPLALAFAMRSAMLRR